MISASTGSYFIPKTWINEADVGTSSGGAETKKGVSTTAINALKGSVRTYEDIVNSRSSSLDGNTVKKLNALAEALKTGENIDLSCLESLPLEEKKVFVAAIEDVMKTAKAQFLVSDKAISGYQEMERILKRFTIDPSASQSVFDAKQECEILSKLMTGDPLDSNAIKLKMNQLLDDHGLVKTNVIIMNALQIAKAEAAPNLKEANKAVLDEKLAWLNNLWPNIDFSQGTNELEQIPNAISNLYFNNKESGPHPDKKVEIRKSTISLGDLQMCNASVNHKHPIQELTGTCCTISFAQALARENLPQGEFLKLMTCINHFADLADKVYLPNSMNDVIYAIEREHQPGNKDLPELLAGITLLVGENMSPVQALINQDVVLATTTEYQYDKREGTAEVRLIFINDQQECACHMLANTCSVSNLQLYPVPDGIATIGRDWGEWTEFCDDAENKTTNIWLVEPAVAGHYTAVLHDTSNCTVTVCESADEISNNLKSMDFVPLQFSCYGASENNKILLNNVLNKKVGLCDNLSHYFQGIEEISVLLGLGVGARIEHVSSTNLIVGNYPRVDSGYAELKSHVSFGKKFQFLAQRLDIAPNNSNKFNLLIEQYKRESQDRQVLDFFNEIDRLVKLDENELRQADLSHLKDLYARIPD